MNDKKLPELLAPCGSPEALDAAIEAGADAVYLGTTLFNARMNAKNFDRAALVQAVNRAHSAGVRVYVTMNTTILDRQMKDALLQVEFLYRSGVDALIVADLGFASLVINAGVGAQSRRGKIPCRSRLFTYGLCKRA